MIICVILFILARKFSPFDWHSTRKVYIWAIDVTDYEKQMIILRTVTPKAINDIEPTYFYTNFSKIIFDECLN